MKKKILLLILLLIFIISCITLVLIYNFLDPYRNILISYISIIISWFLCLSSFFTIILYILKKVYYRWEVYLAHIFTSLRQSIIFTIFLFTNIIFYFYNIFSISTILLIFLICFFLELLFQNLSS